MKVTLEPFRQARGKSKLWIIPVFKGKLPAIAKTYGVDGRQARTWGFDGALKQSLVVRLQDDNHHGLLIGSGQAPQFDAGTARLVMAQGIRHLASQKIDPATVLFAGDPLADSTRVANEVLVEALAEGATLGAYRFSDLKGTGHKSDAPSPPKRCIVTLDRLRNVDRRYFRDGLIMSKWANWARDLLNRGHSHMTATQLASQARRAARQWPAVRCTVMGKKQITAAKMGLFLAVNQGSKENPNFIVLQYHGGRKTAAPICLVGKGLTFDTGGYNIKPGDSMRGMHMDKGGGVGALASFFAAVELGIKQNLVCLVPCTDNRISATAMVPGDVFVGRSGISVEVDNTDAEGRLILADALAYADQYRPSHIIDMATLTGAAVVALGDQAAAMFCTDDTLASQLSDRAVEAGELLWRLPLWDAYEDKLKSKTADVKNVGDRWGGAITAALFLKRFVPDGTKWCHLDIAGRMAAAKDEATTPSGSAYGFGPQLIGRWLRHMS